MKLHEYQSKALLDRAGIPVPPGMVAATPDEAEAAARGIAPVAVKAQVHVGGRGKAGGIKLARTPEEARDAARAILGMDIKGLRVEKVYVERAAQVESELYLGITIDRDRRRPVVMLSTVGGVDIEEVAARSPEKIARGWPDPRLGLLPFEARRLSFEAGVPKELAAWKETTPDELVEEQARELGFSYVQLDGDVGIIGNGAGLVMSTLDAVRNAGGRAANFLDVGGGAKEAVVKAALEIVLSNPRVRSVLINIFGGITRGDEVARGIIDAIRDHPPRVPLVIRLSGTEADAGRRILDGAPLVSRETMDEAAVEAVRLAREVADPVLSGGAGGGRSP